MKLILRPIFQEGEITGAVFVTRDITQRMLVEKALSKSNRALNVLSRANKTVVRASSETDLTNDICRIIINDGRYRLAWVGLAGQDEQKIMSPVSQAGYEDGYLETVQMKGADEKWRNSPAATAIHDREVVIYNNIRTDPRFAPWRDEALARNYNSFIALPLTANGKTFGVLNIYAEEPDAFEKDEKKLLMEMAEDLAFGIMTLRIRSERDRAEEKLHKAYHTLEQRILERTEELNSAKKEAEAANLAKSDFLASMSHELRTPLNAVIGFSELMADKSFGELNERQERYIDNILTSGRHLLSLINDILDLSKVEAGKMELELSEVNIEKTLTDSLTMVKEKAYKHGIHLNVAIPQELSGFIMEADERKLKQVMFNLLSNAVKFTPDNGDISVAACRLQFKNGHLQDQNGQRTTLAMVGDKEPITHGDFIEISVTDTGIGIAPEDQQRIFKEFEQIDSSYVRRQTGTGLGLALTKKFVELHGGRIALQSEGDNKGSTFTFWLPVKNAGTTEKEISDMTGAVLETENGDKLKALIVEDDSRPPSCCAVCWQKPVFL